jgi:low temperature requirement protein LtrA
MSERVTMHEAPVLHHAEGRKATWFELFFDLVFVTAVASLAARLAANYHLAGALQFTFLLLVVWWLWLGHTFHASRFDRDQPDQWAIGFLQMLAVVFIGYGAGDPFGARSLAFAGGVAAFKFLLMICYLRERSRPGLSRLCLVYAGIYGAQALLWAASIALPEHIRLAAWGTALAIDVVTPFLVARETYRAPPHPEHLPERFGLFTIILLGETVAAAGHALSHGTDLHLETVIIATLGATIGFLFWVGYFQRAKGHAERHVGDAVAGRDLRLWAYGHIPLYIGIASLGAGTVFLGHHSALHGAAPWIFSVGAALAMCGVTLASLASVGRSWLSAWPYFAIAVLTALCPIVVHTSVWLAAAVALLALGQLLISQRLSRSVG